MVNPGELPLGRAADALIHAKNTHKRQLPPNIDGETDYERILTKMFRFMDIDSNNKRATFPPIFVESGLKGLEYKAARLTLDKIVAEGGRNDINFRLYSSEHLLYKLQQKCIAAGLFPNQPFSSIIIAKDTLERDFFMHFDIGCDFHRQLDSSQTCALSKVLRSGYNIAKYCLDSSTAVKVPGRHFPSSAKEEIEDHDDVISSVEKDSEWDSIAESFQNFKIGTSNSRIFDTISHRSPFAAMLKQSTNAENVSEVASVSGLSTAPSLSQMIRSSTFKRRGITGKR